jgi:uncharacterized membrane protein (UPF0127 family)
MAAFGPRRVSIAGAVVELVARGARVWKPLRAALRLGIAVAILAIAWQLPAGSASLQNLEIVSATGVHVFSVELASDDLERARGLMYRKELPEGRGMLFDFGTDQDIAMWMKNTFIPLDMMFIRADGRISRIAENTAPLSTKVIPSGGLVRAVLEVAGGTVKKLGISVGDRVAHPLFRGG